MMTENEYGDIFDGFHLCYACDIGISSASIIGWTALKFKVLYWPICEYSQNNFFG
jgi:hypothetical protein